VTNRASIIDPTQRPHNKSRSLSPPDGVFPGDSGNPSTPPMGNLAPGMGPGGVSKEEALMRASKASQLY